MHPLVAMRKTSHDGGDSTSMTSGADGDHRRTSAGILKTTRNSLKRRVQNFSHESDDAVIEPLLQKEKNDISTQSAKLLMSKCKTEQPKGDAAKVSQTKLPPATVTANGVKDSSTVRTVATGGYILSSNVYANVNAPKPSDPAPNTQVLVEVDSNKPIGHTSSPLIFTTAKIHSDGKTKQMEPVHTTGVPISSTIECNNFKVLNVSIDKVKANEVRKPDIQSSNKNISSVPCSIVQDKKTVSVKPVPDIKTNVSKDNVNDSSKGTGVKILTSVPKVDAGTLTDSKMSESKNTDVKITTYSAAVDSKIKENINAYTSKDVKGVHSADSNQLQDKTIMVESLVSNNTLKDKKAGENEKNAAKDSEKEELKKKLSQLEAELERRNREDEKSKILASKMCKPIETKTTSTSTDHIDVTKSTKNLGKLDHNKYQLPKFAPIEESTDSDSDKVKLKSDSSSASTVSFVTAYKVTPKAESSPKDSKDADKTNNMPTAAKTDTNNSTNEKEMTKPVKAVANSGSVRSTTKTMNVTVASKSGTTASKSPTTSTIRQSGPVATSASASTTKTSKLPTSTVAQSKTSTHTVSSTKTTVNTSSQNKATDAKSKQLNKDTKSSKA